MRIKSLINPSKKSKNRIATAGIGALAFTALPLVIGGVPSASAITCGYHTQMDDAGDSGIGVALPIVGNVDPFGGKRQQAYWGNCSDANEKISVSTAAGTEEACVTPGATLLGQTNNEKKVSGATKIGSC